MDRSTTVASGAHRLGSGDDGGRRGRRVAITVALAAAALVAPFVIFSGTDSSDGTPGGQAAPPDAQPLTMVTTPTSTPPSATDAPAPTAGPSGRPSPVGSNVTPAVTGQPVSGALTAGVFFDDFAYAGVQDAAFGRTWDARDYQGGPGSTNATWSPTTISFAGSGSASVMTMTATTDGTAAGTTESEVDSQKTAFLDGTYAVRIRFTTAPVGPTGAHVNETLFALSNAGETDPNYSEMDVGYQPTGSASDTRTQLDLTTWRSGTDSDQKVLAANYDGWHTVVITVGNGTVAYYVDGASLFTTSGGYYPREKMQLAFNEWFNEGELGPPGATRTYTQQVDWTYLIVGRVLSPAQVQQQVDAERSAGRTVVDNLGAG